MRLAVSIGAMIGGFVASAIVLALVDLHVTGHGGPSIDRPWILRPSLGVSLGRADLVALLVAAGAGAAALSRQKHSYASRERRRRNG